MNRRVALSEAKPTANTRHLSGRWASLRLSPPYGLPIDGVCKGNEPLIPKRGRQVSRVALSEAKPTKWSETLVVGFAIA